MRRDASHEAGNSNRDFQEKLVAAHFPGTTRGGVNRFDAGCAKRAGFEGLESCDGSSARGGDHVLEHGRMLAGGLNHGRRPEDGLSGKCAGLVAGEAVLDSAVGEGFDEDLEEFVEWCHEGPDKAEVESVKVWKGQFQNYEDFEIAYR